MIIHLVLYKLFLELTNFNFVAIGFGLLSILIYYLVILLAQVPYLADMFQPQILGLVPQLVYYPEFWLLVIAGPLACLVPDLCAKLAGKVFFPDPVEKVLLEQAEFPDFDFFEELRSQDKEAARRERKAKEAFTRRQTIAELALNADAYEKQESKVNLKHIEDQLPHSFKNKRSIGRAKATSSSSSILEEDSERSIKHKKKYEESKIEEVDEEDVTDNDDDSSSDEPSDDEQSDEEDESPESAAHESLSNSQKSHSVDQSFRSNRGLLGAEKSVQEIREARKQVSLRSKQSLKGQASLRRNKTKSGKPQNNSIFSVSDASRSEEPRKEAKSEYLEYFEDLNKEIIDKQNVQRQRK